MEKCCKCKTSLMAEDNWYGLDKNCIMDWFELPSLSDFSDIIPRSQSLAPLENHGKNASFFSWGIS